MDLMSRRKELMMSKSEPYLYGWIQGYYMGKNGIIRQSGADILSPKLAVVAGHQVKYYYQKTAARYVCFWNGDSVAGSYATNGEDTLTIPNNATTMQMSFPKNNIDNCYILDVTTNRYIFKGQNI